LRAAGLYNKLSIGATAVSLVLALEVFLPLEELCVSIQSRSQSVPGTMSAVKLVIEKLCNSRSEVSFAAIYSRANDLVTELDLEAVSAPRVRRQSKRIDGGSPQFVPANPEQYYRVEYYKIVDAAVARLTELFDQPGLDRCSYLESCLLKPSDLSQLSCYPEIDIDRLSIQLNMFQMTYKVSTVKESADIFRSMPSEVRGLFTQVEVLIRLLLVVPASSAEAERSFSTLRRLKTWLRSTVGQRRLNHLAVLNIHSARLDAIDMTAVARDFVAKNDGRRNDFGSFG
jgi:hypothetical protein